MENAAQSFIRGIDVSVYQGNINWAEVAKSGVVFVKIRASYGVTDDTSFAANWSGAKGAGVIRGPYHYFIPTDDVQSQVDVFVKAVGSLQAGDLPPALDLEDPSAWTSIAQADRLPLVLKWLTAVEAALGVKPEVYLDLNFISQVFGDATALGAYGLWLAFYSSASSPTLPSQWTTWRFWQWSDTTTVPGITGDVDGDRFSGTLAELVALGFSASASASSPSASSGTAATGAPTTGTVTTGAVTTGAVTNGTVATGTVPTTPVASPGSPT
jgi:lysozyme